MVRRVNLPFTNLVPMLGYVRLEAMRQPIEGRLLLSRIASTVILLGKFTIRLLRPSPLPTARIPPPEAAHPFVPPTETWQGQDEAPHLYSDAGYDLVARRMEG